MSSFKSTIAVFLVLFTVGVICSQSCSDFAELFQGGFEVFDDFLGENVGIGKVVGFFEAFVSEPEKLSSRKDPPPL